MRTRLLLASSVACWIAGGLASQDPGVSVFHGVVFPDPVVTGDTPAVPPPPRLLGEDATPHDHTKNLPPVPVGDGNLPQPNSPETMGRDATSAPGAPCDLRFFENTVVKPSGASTSLVGEPAIAQVRDTCLQTGNWYAARSLNSGVTWSYVSPYTRFSATDGGFCCDQRAIYVPSADITVWFLQHSYSSTTQQGGQRIAVANGRADLRAGSTGSWHSWYFDPQNFGRPSGEWLDFPDIAFSNGYMYFATNCFNSSSQFQDAIVWRASLANLAAGGALSYSYARSTTGLGGASYRLTQNAAGTMYFGEHRSTTTTRAFRWADGPGNISWTDISVPDWSSTTGYVARGPNNVNWGGRADSRILGAYYKSGEYGFMWHCGPRSGRAQVYVRTIRIRSSNNTLIATEDTWSSTYQFMYPAAAVNSGGEIGCCTAIANSTSLHPTTCYFMVDSCQPNFHGQAVSWFTGNASPTSANRWGDYFTIQRHSHYPQTFVGTGMTCRDGGGNGNSEPHYVWFCRESDLPTAVTLSVTSTPVTGIAISVDPADRSNRTNGSTNFTRSYSPRQEYELTAPSSHASGGTTWVFDRWALNGGLQPIDQRVLSVSDIGAVADTAEARYVARRTLQVRSSNPTSGIAISVSVRDLNGSQNGTTAFDRLYKHGTTVTLTAPAANGIHPFKQWILNRANQPLGQRSLSVLVDSTETATAVYYTHVNGSYTQFCSGCPGTGARVPLHTGVGTPEIGSAIGLRVSNAVGNSGGAMYLGSSRTTYNGLSLPLNLGFLGMGPTCLLCVSVDLSVGFATNASGVATVNIPLPNSTSLINSHIYSQAALVDLGAGTTVPIVHSNALDTQVGGDF